MTMSHLGQLMARYIQTARTGNADECREPISGSTRQVTGLRSEARFGDLTMVIDEPVSFGGTGLAPNPAEVALAALGASLEVTLRCYAEYLKIPLQDITIELESALDIRGFFCTDNNVPAGFGRVGLKVGLSGPYSEAQLQELIAYAEKACPVLDVFRRPMNVEIAFSGQVSKKQS